MQLNEIISSFWKEEKPSEISLEEMSARMMGVLKYNYESMGEEIDTQELINQLSHADHLYNWLFRKKEKINTTYTIIENGHTANENDIDYLHTVEHEEIFFSNKAVEKEWKKIKSKYKPGWFQSLPKWEKNILLDFYKIWKNREILIGAEINETSEFHRLPINVKEKLINKVIRAQKSGSMERMSFIEFVGMQTGYMPYYPSVRNGYRVLSCLYKSSGEEERKMILVRKASFVRTAIPFVFSSSEDEMVRLTVNNIKQAILFDIIYPFRRISNYSNEKLTVCVPVLIQSLASHHRRYNDDMIKNVLYEAIDKVRDELKSKSHTAKFMKDNIEELKDIVNRDTLIDDAEEFLNSLISNKRIMLKICFITHDVFKHSFWEQVKIPFSREKKEYDFLIETINEELCKLISRSVFVGTLPLVKTKHFIGKIKIYMDNKNPLYVMDELRLLGLSDVTYKIPALKLGVDGYKMFLAAADDSFYKAAYLLITFSAIGLRVGGCANGCDFEGPLILLVNSLRIFYAKYGCFPEHPLVSDKEIDVFHEYVAKEFLEGYCHNILEYSSQGCSGLTFLDNTLGPKIRKKIVKMSSDYGIDSSKYDLYANALSISRLEIVSECNELENIDEIINDSAKSTKKIEVDLLFDDIAAGKYREKELPAEFIEKDNHRINMEKIAYNKFDEKIKSIFSVNGLSNLKVELQRSSKSTPMGSTMSRILKFRSKYIGEIKKK